MKRRAFVLLAALICLVIVPAMPASADETCQSLTVCLFRPDSPNTPMKVFTIPLQDDDDYNDDVYDGAGSNFGLADSVSYAWNGFQNEWLVLYDEPNYDNVLICIPPGEQRNLATTVEIQGTQVVGDRAESHEVLSFSLLPPVCQ